MLIGDGRTCTSVLLTGVKVLFKRSGLGFPEIKVSDFGISIFQKMDEGVAAIGTEFYMAPVRLQDDSYGPL